MKVVTVEEMRRIEAASDAAGHSYSKMMERAGRAVADVIISRWDVQGDSPGSQKRILVLVGPGNNGGDGLVAARYLSKAGASVACYLLKQRSPADDENFYLVQRQGVEVVLAEEDKGWAKLRNLVSEANVIVDALLGTGAHLPLRSQLAEMLSSVRQELAAQEQAPFPALLQLNGIPEPLLCDELVPLIVAVDGPTGLDYDSGALDEAALPADLTVTFAYPKLAHFRFPGASAVGEMIVADIGTDPELADDVALEVVTPSMLQEWLPPRSLDAHKGTFGKALIVAGSVNYTGAAYLAGAAAARSGAGLVTLALPSIIYESVAARLGEATYLILPHELGVIAADGMRALIEKIEEYEALLLGPGMGHEQTTADFIDALLKGVKGHSQLGFASSERKATASLTLPPLVVDADGLNILAEMNDWPRRLPPESILTPHPGEMGRLMGCTAGDVQANRVAVAKTKAADWGHVVVLKGAYTVVAAPDGRTVIEPFANPGLATAGTGDVLAGAIVAMRAQGMEAFEAAVAGAYLHGLAGELAREQFGPAGMVAGDVLAHLPQAWRYVACKNGDKQRPKTFDISKDRHAFGYALSYACL